MRVCRLLAVAGVLALAARAEAAPKKSQTATPPPVEDVRQLFSPESPICPALEVSMTPIQEAIPFGQEPEFRISLKNTSAGPIDLAGEMEQGILFNPYMVVGMVGSDGKPQITRLDWVVPEKHRLLQPGTVLSFRYPLRSPGETAPPPGNYRQRPDVLLPGKYRAFVNFWVLNGGENQRAISPGAAFTVTSDGSKEVDITRQLQEGRSLPAGFQFRLQQVGASQVKVIAVNGSKEGVYLGNQWGWWRRYPGKAPTEDKTGPRPASRTLVPAGRSVELQTVPIGSGDISGEYQIQFRYYNQEGRLVAQSDILTARLAKRLGAE